MNTTEATIVHTIHATRIDDRTMAALLARGRAERSTAARSLFASLGRALVRRSDGTGFEGLRMTTR